MKKDTSKSINFNKQSLSKEFSFNKMINISGAQRMLCQRISKLYLIFLEDTTDKVVKKKLLTSIEVFLKENKFLHENKFLKKNGNNQITEDIENVMIACERLKGLFEAKVSLSGAKKIINSNTTLLKKVNKIVKSIVLAAIKNKNAREDTSNEKNMDLSLIIDFSSKQAMFLQRLTLYYYADRKHFETLKRKTILKNTYETIGVGISELEASTYNNEKINALLSEIKDNWNKIVKDQGKLFQQGLDANAFATKTNELTNEFTRLTLLYQELED